MLGIVDPMAKVAIVAFFAGFLLGIYLARRGDK